jgi:hypothetical protein
MQVVSVTFPFEDIDSLFNETKSQSTGSFADRWANEKSVKGDMHS